MSDKVEISLNEQNELIRTLKEAHFEGYMSARKNLLTEHLLYENIRLVYLISQRLRDSNTLEEASYWNAVMSLVLVQATLRDDELRNKIELSLSYLLK